MPRVIDVAVGLGVSEGPRAALAPLAGALLFGAVLYKVLRDPPKPTRWTRPRVVASAALFGTAGLTVVTALIWLLIVRSEWPIRIVAVIGILSVQVLGVWLLQVARA